MDDLVQFVTARLDEEAELAASASPGPWSTNAEADEVLAVDGVTVADGFALSGQQLRATTRHIARHGPARVLAEVDAKRVLLTEYERLKYEVMSDDMSGVTALERVLRAKAAVHADHPDYQEAWRP